MRNFSKKQRKKANLAKKPKEPARRKEEKVKEILQKYSELRNLDASTLIASLIELNPETLEEGDLFVLEEESSNIYYAGRKLTDEVFTKLIYPLGYTYKVSSINSSKDKEKFLLKIA